ncbi:phage tail protein [Photorhabdus heterorhabditis]|uniref:phage tail protein n=1 Tax=Photorhabdus heterorhabditis TaxID=880156 RepID=UPI0009F830B3|nr:phage tail protein [Photorhabdus heterorhabditis]
MSQKNDFKAFSISNNANVVSQRLYEESKDLLTGFPPNDVSTHMLNKALRQSSTISSVLADFIAEQSGEDVLDDGNVNKLTAQLNRALEQKIATEVPTASLTQKGVVQLTDVTGNSNTLAATQKLVSAVNDSVLAKNQNGVDIPDKNAFVKNLGLVETVNLAKSAVPNSRKVNSKVLSGDVNLSAGDVGAYSKGESDGRYQPRGSYQPAGNYAVRGECYTKQESDSRYGAKNTANISGNGWWECKDTGIIYQWASHSWRSGQSLNFNFPRVFPNAVFVIMVTDSSGYQSMGTTNRSRTGFTLTGNQSLLNFSYIAIGY